MHASGVLPNGQLVAPELTGMIGRVSVISLHDNAAASDFLRACTQKKFHPVQHLYDCARLPSEYVCVLALRLFATAVEPFGLQRSEVIHRLTGVPSCLHAMARE